MFNNRSEYDSYRFRSGKNVGNYTKIESDIMRLLIKFGKGIDPNGYDGGDYTTAMEGFKKIVDKAIGGGYDKSR